jgi:hypothetical protein
MSPRTSLANRHADTVLAVEQPPSDIERISLSAIRFDGGTQMRAALNDDAINDYADQMQDIGNWGDFPPIVVFYDGTAYWLADGFHRVRAAQRANIAPDVPAKVQSGDRRGAILYAVKANANHGLRRTNADKRRAVETLLRDDEWRQWSDAEIGRRCAVDAKTVSNWRRTLTSNREIPDSVIRKAADGRTIDTRNMGANQPKRDRTIPTPPPAKVVYVEPDPVADPPVIPTDLAQSGYRLDRSEEHGRWRFIKAGPVDTYGLWRPTPDAAIADARWHYDKFFKEKLQPAAPQGHPVEAEYEVRPTLKSDEPKPAIVEKLINAPVGGQAFHLALIGLRPHDLEAALAQIPLDEVPRREAIKQTLSTLRSLEAKTAQPEPVEPANALQPESESSAELKAIASGKPEFLASGIRRHEHVMGNLITVPSHDGNFKGALDDATAEELIEALTRIPADGNKTKRERIEARLQKVQAQTTLAADPLALTYSSLKDRLYRVAKDLEPGAGIMMLDDYLEGRQGWYHELLIGYMPSGCDEALFRQAASGALAELKHEATPPPPSTSGLPIPALPMPNQYGARPKDERIAEAMELRQIFAAARAATGRFATITGKYTRIPAVLRELDPMIDDLDRLIAALGGKEDQ